MNHTVPRRVVMVTGATQYTGFAIAELFAKRGFDVCVTSRDYAKAEKAVDRRQDICRYKWTRPMWMRPRLRLRKSGNSLDALTFL